MNDIMASRLKQEAVDPAWPFIAAVLGFARSTAVTWHRSAAGVTN